MAANYEDEKFDNVDGNTPALDGKLDENNQPSTKPVYVVVGLDGETRWAEQMDKWGRSTAKFVSLHGHNLYQYYKDNCPVTEGLDPLRLQGEEGQEIMRNTYRCMAGIYVGRTESGKMCYTFFDRDGKVSHVNDKTAVYPFSPGSLFRKSASGTWEMELPYSGYHIADGFDMTYDPATGAFTIMKGKDIVQKVPVPVPVFSRLDVGGNMFMILNLMRRYANPLGVEQKLDVTQNFRTQQAVFKFNSSAQTIDIFQYNTDSGFGTGALEDTCYVNFRAGTGEESKADPGTSTSSSSN